MAGATAVGVLDGAVPVHVGPDGTVRTPGLVLRPWIGADDRWYRLDQEVAVRQRLAGDAPVVETLLRVPGGDVLWRAYGARPAGGGEALVVEIENGTSVPVALGLVARPASSWRVEGPALWATDVEPAPQAALLVGARAPGLVLAGEDLGDLFTRLASSRGLATDDADLGTAAAGDDPYVVLVHPVTHGTTSTFVVPLAGPPPAAGALGGLPPADAVARGWRQLLGAAALVELPEPSWGPALAATRAQLVLEAAAVVDVEHAFAAAGASAPAAAQAIGAASRALDAWGHHDEAARLLTVLTSALATSFDAEVCAAFLSALHQHWRLGGGEGLAEAAVEDLARAVAVVDRALRRRPGGSDADRLAAALAGAARVLRAAGEGAAADVVAGRLAARAGGAGDAGRARALEGPGEASPEAVDGLLRAASSTWTWPEPWLGARLLLGVRSVLVAGDIRGAGGAGGAGGGRGGDTAEGLDLLPGWRPHWRGQGLEVHGLPVGTGRLSYAVRWHGPRPALLWEVVTDDGEDVPVVLRASALDPTWRAEGARGEALLQAPPGEAGVADGDVGNAGASPVGPTSPSGPAEGGSDGAGGAREGDGGPEDGPVEFS